MILGVLAARLGTEPFVDGLRHTDPRALVVALAVTALTTACCARRWSLVAGGLGVGVPFGTAYRACYRAQLLNATLPAGILGDVHRGYRHGRDAGALGLGLRSVVWERSCGQVVLVAMAAAAVPLLPSPVRGGVLAVLAVVVCAGAAVLGGARREAAAVLGRVWPEVLLLSALAACGHVLVFIVAARSVGITLSAPHLLALALLVLLASAAPVSLAGWGPREGAAAWAFGASGLGAGTGVEVAVVLGVMALVATLPGLLVRMPRPADAASSGESEAEPSREARAKGGRAWASGPTSS